MRERLRPSRIQLTTGQTLFTPRCWACCWPRGPPGLGGRCLLRRCSFSWPEPRSACARRTACWPDVSRSPSPLTARACGPTFLSFAKGAFGAKAGESPAPPNSAGQIFPAYAEVLQVAQDGQGDVFGIEEGPRDGLHVAGGDGFDARHQFVEREEPAEVHLLARQEMYFGRFFTLDELVASIESVTAGDVQTIARTFFDTKHIALTVLGNLRIGREDLAC